MGARGVAAIRRVPNPFAGAHCFRLLHSAALDVGASYSGIQMVRMYDCIVLVSSAHPPPRSPYLFPVIFPTSQEVRSTGAPDLFERLIAALASAGVDIPRARTDETFWALCHFTHQYLTRAPS
ncbi:hypothetical protein B0H10DRAFT_334332 [Mycena sp. CBHHK59/15]|nr:hypothetical protein B0H10DRAFT_334332 [Mycena sp. CBHHK59/15]